MLFVNLSIISNLLKISILFLSNYGPDIDNNSCVLLHKPVIETTHLFFGNQCQKT